MARMRPAARTAAAMAALLLAGATVAQADDREALYKSNECAIYYDNLAKRFRGAGDATRTAAAEKKRDQWEEVLEGLEIATKVPGKEISAIEDRAYAEHKRQVAQGDWAAYEKRYARQCP